jgi:hypothetical protein
VLYLNVSVSDRSISVIGNGVTCEEIIKIGLESGYEITSILPNDEIMQSIGRNHPNLQLVLICDCLFSFIRFWFCFCFYLLLIFCLFQIDKLNSNESIPILERTGVFDLHNHKI